MYFRFLHFYRDFLRSEDVVDALTYVSLACASEVAPPGVEAVSLGEKAKRIYEA
jgi:hypothetical protein